MAGYTVLNTQFTPYTFDEMVKPLLMYKQEADKYNDEISSIEQKTAAYQNYIDKTSTPEIEKVYSGYMNDLNNATTSMGSSNFSTIDKSKLQSLRKRYAQEIAPIEIAFKAKEADVKQYYEDKKKGDYISTYDPTQKSVDYYYKNPYQRQSGIYGENVTKDTAEWALAGGKDRLKTSMSKIKFGYNKITQHGGWTSDDIYKATHGRINEVDGGEILQEIIDNVKAKNKGAFDSENPENLARFTSAINKGLQIGGVGQKTENIQQNQADMMALEFQYWKKKKDEEEAGKGGAPSGYSQLHFKNKEELKTTIANDILDKNGKIRRDKVDVDFDINGKMISKTLRDPRDTFFDPKKTSEISKGSREDRLRLSKMYVTLQSIGYSDEEILDMTKPKIEKALAAYSYEGKSGNLGQVTMRSNYLSPETAQNYASRSSTIREVIDFDYSTGQAVYGNEMSTQDFLKQIKGSEVAYGSYKGRPTYIWQGRTYELPAEVMGTHIANIAKEKSIIIDNKNAELKSIDKAIASTPDNDPRIMSWIKKRNTLDNEIMTLNDQLDEMVLRAPFGVVKEQNINK